jgi:hypothetical protein
MLHFFVQNFKLEVLENNLGGLKVEYNFQK